MVAGAVRYCPIVKTALRILGLACLSAATGWVLLGLRASGWNLRGAWRSACDLCSRPAGFRYAGPVFGRQPEVVCLRCIADGTAAISLGLRDGIRAEFTDVGWGVPDDVPKAVREEISQRTPGFIGWQQEHWLYHCADAAAFLGRVGWDDVRPLPDALASLRADLVQLGVDASAAEEQIAAMHRDGELTGYLFRCLHCGTHFAYSDAS
ncbi:CbrC family protein [Kribbella sp. NPDC051936]|uniref:CbrC family protein n=1 Tax=Kribbella sp. NPDC051936 TaxID=3154946 RepID=UPI00343CD114